jgi:hypothetical protein
MKRRVAAKAVDVRTAIPIADRLRQLGAPASDELPAPGPNALPSGGRLDAAERLYSDGVLLEYLILEFVHGNADMGTLPSQSQLSEWQVRCNFAAAIVARYDPEFMAGFIGRLPAKDQGLVRSMIKNGELRTQRGR